jgi:hypothetical protein
MNILKSIIVPAAHSLIGSETLKVEHCTEILAITTIYTRDIRSTALSI